MVRVRDAIGSTLKRNDTLEIEYRAIPGGCGGKNHWVKSIENPRRPASGGTLCDCALFDISTQKSLEMRAKEEVEKATGSLRI